MSRKKSEAFIGRDGILLIIRKKKKSRGSLPKNS
jgi:hypothetical protein